MMTLMKRYILLGLLLTAMLLLPVRSQSAAAESGQYAVAVGEVWFYTSADENAKLFLLPETYYVRVLDSAEEFCTVEYQTDDAPYKKILGYCRTDALTFVDFTPARPYLRKQITVTYTLPEAGDLGSEDFTSVERTYVYYGDRYEGDQLYLYVLLEDTFGYLPADEVPAFERNTDYLQNVSGEAPPETEDGSANALQIVVIVLACVAAIAVAVILLRGKRPPREQKDF